MDSIPYIFNLFECKMQNAALFVCIVGGVMAIHMQPPTTTRSGSRPIMPPQMSASFYSDLKSVTRTPLAGGPMTYGPTTQWSSNQNNRFSGLQRSARGRLRPFGVAPGLQQGGMNLFSPAMMRMLLPMIMANEGEGFNILFLAQMIDQRRTSPYMKIHILSGRMGEDAQKLGRCVFLMRLPKVECVIMMLMTPG